MKIYIWVEHSDLELLNKFHHVDFFDGSEITYYLHNPKNDPNYIQVEIEYDVYVQLTESENLIKG